MEAKQVQKSYADRYLNTKTVEFKQGDIVKLKWNRSHSKYLSLLDDSNYIVSEVNGTMITASKLNVKGKLQSITRNSSFFKHASVGQIPNIKSNLSIEYEEHHNNPFDLVCELIKPADPLSTRHDIETFEDQIIDLDLFVSQHEKLNSIEGSTDESEEDSFDETYEPPNREPISEDYSTDSCSYESDTSGSNGNLKFCFKNHEATNSIALTSIHMDDLRSDSMNLPSIVIPLTDYQASQSDI